jgi:hypothetical protein
MLLAQQVQKWILQELAFVAHDILRVGCEETLTLSQGQHAAGRHGLWAAAAGQGHAASR